VETSVRYDGVIDGKSVTGEIDLLMRVGDTLIVIEAKEELSAAAAVASG
jgi:Holliday junction resolvase-like predicted endonuclease